MLCLHTYYVILYPLSVSIRVHPWKKKEGVGGFSEQGAILRGRVLQNYRSLHESAQRVGLWFSGSCLP